MVNYEFSVRDRFIRYVQIDTQADPNSTSFPSTEKQKNLGKLLAEELRQIGIEDIEFDDYGYVYGTIPSNTDKNVPVICFCSHMDTAPDCSGTNVQPIVHEKWDGTDIVLPDDRSQILSIQEHPYLQKKMGEDIITASGTTLLGADDKAGLAIIMDMAAYLMTHPEIRHGKIRLLFTPDEEVGRGVNHVDMKKLGADYGYTLDGGERGSLEGDTFSADAVQVIIHGVSAHPGYAKDKLVNALKIAGEFLDALPKEEWSPETTDGEEGYIHPIQIRGIAEKTTIDFIIRDFKTELLQDHENRLKSILDDIIQKYPKARAEFHVTEQYRNMREILNKFPQVEQFAAEAMERCGIKPERQLVRGGTDGSRLSFMGLPCPNLFTGEMAIHSKLEYVSIQDMQKSVEMLIHLVQIWEEKATV